MNICSYLFMLMRKQDRQYTPPPKKYHYKLCTPSSCFYIVMILYFKLLGKKTSTRYWIAISSKCENMQVIILKRIKDYLSSLTSTFYWSACSKQGELEVMYVCGCGINFVSLYHCSIRFWNCSSSVLFFFIFNLIN